MIDLKYDVQADFEAGQQLEAERLNEIVEGVQGNMDSIEEVQNKVPDVLMDGTKGLIKCNGNVFVLAESPYSGQSNVFGCAPNVTNVAGAYEGEVCIYPIIKGTRPRVLGVSTDVDWLVYSSQTDDCIKLTIEQGTNVERTATVTLTCGSLTCSVQVKQGKRKQFGKLIWENWDESFIPRSLWETGVLIEGRTYLISTNIYGKTDSVAFINLSGGTAGARDYQFDANGAIICNRSALSYHSGIRLGSASMASLRFVRIFEVFYGEDETVGGLDANKDTSVVMTPVRQEVEPAISMDMFTYYIPIKGAVKIVCYNPDIKDGDYEFPVMNENFSSTGYQPNPVVTFKNGWGSINIAYIQQNVKGFGGNATYFRLRTALQYAKMPTYNRKLIIYVMKGDRGAYTNMNNLTIHTR